MSFYDSIPRNWKTFSPSQIKHTYNHNQNYGYHATGNDVLSKILERGLLLPDEKERTWENTEERMWKLISDGHFIHEGIEDDDKINAYNEMFNEAVFFFWNDWNKAVEESNNVFETRKKRNKDVDFPVIIVHEVDPNHVEVDQEHHYDEMNYDNIDLDVKNDAMALYSTKPLSPQNVECVCKPINEKKVYHGYDDWNCWCK